MSEVVLIEQVDEGIEAMFRTSEAPCVAADPTIAELVSIAVELRALPRADFKTHLKHELESEAAMIIESESDQSGDESPQPESPMRATFRTVTPYLTVANVHEEIEFVTKVFGAEGTIYGLGSAGGYHSEYRIGDSMVMVGGGGEGAQREGAAAPGGVHLYVVDVGRVYERAVQAGVP